MNIIKLPSTILLMLGAFALTGCSDSGGSAGIAPVNVPAQALTFDSSNAAGVADKAIGTTSTLLGKGATPTPSAGNIIAQALDITHDKVQNSGIDMVTGVTITETLDCANPNNTATAGDPNTMTIQVSATQTASGGSESGSITFVSCEMVLGTTINGSLSYNGSWSSNGDYSDNVTGNLSMQTGGETISLTNLTFQETGNEFSGDFVMTVMQYVYDPGTNGFAVQATSSIIGNGIDCGPSAGVVLISGASNTHVRLTFGQIAPDFMTVELDTGDGNFAEVIESPVYMCSGI